MYGSGATATILLFNALPEEYGWRGYALGPMLKRSNALVASLVLGLLWGLWHLPLHFIEGTVLGTEEPQPRTRGQP